MEAKIVNRNIDRKKESHSKTKQINFTANEEIKSLIKKGFKNFVIDPKNSESEGEK